MVSSNHMKSAFLFVFLMALLGLERAASASIITVFPDSVNRLIQSLPTTNSTDLFSTFPGQSTVVTTSNATLLAALQAVLGVAPANYIQINSATLTVGSSVNNDDYTGFATGTTGHLILVSNTASQVTWNDRATLTPWNTVGLAAGVDYASAAATTGVFTPSNPTTETDFPNLGSVVQGWIQNTTSNFGLFFFAATGASDQGTITDSANVVWTIDAVTTPEPASLSLLAGGSLLMLRRRRK